MAPHDVIYVAKQTAQELVVVSPGYRLLAAIFLGCAVVALVISVFVALKLRVALTMPWRAAVWLGPILFCGPFLVLGLWLGTARTSLMLSSADEKLSLEKTICGVSVRSESYRFDEIRGVGMGIGDTCRFLYLSLKNGKTTTLLGCTDRDGYDQAANAINSFLSQGNRAQK
ncbi:MAG TPA: hypothetical protein VKZ53_15820 [Candidatus Angelobacter sp.]|nr:hypothetical protein [Candidatus Angelobacter sp.]